MKIMELALKRNNTVYQRMALSARRALWKLVDDLRNGIIDIPQFNERVEAVLFDAHSRASVIGRHISGDLAPINAEDRMLASLNMDRQKTFLERFLSDIEGGRYTAEDGRLIRSAVNNRLQLYASATRGTMHESFVAVSPRDSVFDWILIAENNCDDCPIIAAGSPYTKLTLPSFPGDGSTQCLTNCKCVLLRDDGVVTAAYPYEEVEDLAGAI